MQLYEHQKKALEATEGLNRVAYYHDQGLGKTFTGAEKMYQLKTKVNIIICQKSKVDDWISHLDENYPPEVLNYNLTRKGDLDCFLREIQELEYDEIAVAVINYDLAWRRKELLQLKEFTLMLDESSLIQNEQSKRSKFILKLQPKNVILLSGTPTGGKYETLWSQLHLLGWNISKEMYYSHYIDYHWDEANGFPLRIIDGYKNVERLKKKMRAYGCHFLKTEDCIDLPEQIDQTVKVPVTKEYRIFKEDRICEVDGVELVGDTTLTKLLYERQLCGQYSVEKLDAFRSLLESTNDRLIVFYNFNDELETLKNITWQYTQNISEVNGSFKDLTAYEQFDDSITFIQYQAGAMGLNLQKANKIVYFTPPLSSELFEQSKKRIHRIGQKKTCFYYYLTCKSSIEEKIYKTLAMRKDYTDALFERGD